MNRIETAALLAAMAVSSGAWAHGDEAHKKTSPVRKEQKDWGIAGDAKSVKRTIVVHHPTPTAIYPPTA